MKFLLKTIAVLSLGATLAGCATDQWLNGGYSTGQFPNGPVYSSGQTPNGPMPPAPPPPPAYSSGQTPNGPMPPAPPPPAYSSGQIPNGPYANGPVAPRPSVATRSAHKMYGRKHEQDMSYAGNRESK